MHSNVLRIHPLCQILLLKSLVCKQLEPPRDPDALDSTEPPSLSEDQDTEASLQIIGLNVENKPSPAALTLKGPVIHIDGQ